MLLSLNGLNGMMIRATDGQIGSVTDLLFDDEKWTVRYLVVNTGNWLIRNEVLISPISVRGLDPEARLIAVGLTRDQVEHSPDIDTQQPVSRQMEKEYLGYFGWPYYWSGEGVWGPSPYPSGSIGMPKLSESQDEQQHLRSRSSVEGYGIEARDSRFGHVEDFIMDTESWQIRYLVIDTRNWWPSKSVLVSPEWVESISWLSRKVRLSLTEEKVKGSPEFNPEEGITREYEEQLCDWYGRPKYWKESRLHGLRNAESKPGKYVI